VDQFPIGGDALCEVHEPLGRNWWESSTDGIVRMIEGGDDGIICVYRSRCSFKASAVVTNYRLKRCLMAGVYFILLSFSPSYRGAFVVGGLCD
jgi:hypothetical protein